MRNSVNTASSSLTVADDSPIDRLRNGLQPIAHKAIFCTWRLENGGNGHDKPRKVPYVYGGSRLAGRYDAPDLQAKLMTLEDAIAERQLRQHSGVGLAFFPGCGVIGVDFDHCLDATRKLTLTPAQHKALALLNGVAFTERSQSDTGVHAIVLGDAPTVKANGELEVFGDKNFIALTGFAGKGVASQIDRDRIDKVIALVAKIKDKAVLSSEDLKRKTMRGGTSGGTGVDELKLVHVEEGKESVARILGALRFIDPDVDRDTWLKIIFAIRHGLGDRPEAFELADRWSKGELHAGN